jgi:hypothetical protein
LVLATTAPAVVIQYDAGTLGAKQQRAVYGGKVFDLLDLPLYELGRIHAFLSVPSALQATVGHYERSSQDHSDDSYSYQTSTMVSPRSVNRSLPRYMFYSLLYLA